MNRIMDCPICGGDDYHVAEWNERRGVPAGVEAGMLVYHTRGTCADCGRYVRTDSRFDGDEQSGFKSLDDLNDLRYSLSRDDLTHDEFVEIRTRINAPIGEFMDWMWKEPDDSFWSSVINRRQASHE